MTIVNMTVRSPSNQTGEPSHLGGKYHVLLDGKRIAGFNTNAEAWKYIDKWNGEDVDGCAARHSWSTEQWLKQ